MLMKHLVLIMAAVATMAGTNAAAQTRVKNIYAENQTLKVSEIANTEQTVQLNRYLMAGYNSLCLPVALDAEQLQAAAAGVRVERFVGIRQEGSTLSLLFTDCTDNGIEAGVPYLIFSPKAQYLRVKNTNAQDAAQPTAIVKTDDNGNRIVFGSSWTTRTKDGLYGIPAKQDKEVLESILMRTNGEQSFLPTRCGFAWEQQSATASELEISHISLSEATAISTVAASADNAATAYDLNGRRIVANGKGIIIKGGKKISRK